jgi:hypothetical protein
MSAMDEVCNVLNYIREGKPRAVLLECVPGLVSQPWAKRRFVDALRRQGPYTWGFVISRPDMHMRAMGRRVRLYGVGVRE